MTDPLDIAAGDDHRRPILLGAPGTTTTRSRCPVVPRDLGPLLAAVTFEWERGKTIAARAGINSRTAGPRLASLERQGFVVSSIDKEARVALYRRGPKAPPVPVPSEPHPAQILHDLRSKLAEMGLHDATGDPLDVGYMQAVEEIDRWLDEQEVPQPDAREDR